MATQRHLEKTKVEAAKATAQSIAEINQKIDYLVAAMDGILVELAELKEKFGKSQANKR